MKRRRFFGFATLAGLGLAAKPAAARSPAAASSSGTAGDAIDPYYLDRGDLSPNEQEQMRAFLAYQEQRMAGQDAILPRGGRPKRAPSYRLLSWQGELGDASGSLVGPLTVSPGLSGPPPYAFNAQILGFHVATADFGETGQGALSIEFRTRYRGEPLTWMYLQQFEARKGGGNTVGLEYVAQREGEAIPVISEGPSMDMRIQLIRYRTSPGVLRKILKVGAFLTGLPVGGGGGGGSSDAASFAASQPVVRVPQMVHEGVAMAQATIGGMSDEAPIWRGGFSTFALATGGSRLGLRPGLWLAVDDSEEVDYASLRLGDVGGRVGVLRDGAPVDLNYLVLGLEMEGSAEPAPAPAEVVPKGKS